MRSTRFLLLLCAIAVCFYSVAAAPRVQLGRRQDGNSDGESTIIASESSKPTSTAIRENSSISQISTSTASKETRDPVASTSTSIPATAAVDAPSATASHSSEDISPGDLPIQPKITPALGIAGVIFILSGVVYTVIGIKNKWLYVFTSAAYLSSLAVTVLIVYLMSPPVSNAIQGAFFVAACVTGLLFGALSLVFSDITEGLGCLLGGFCLSMWFLTLKEGGLIQSTGGRAILIGCMSVAAYALSWSHHTREYGLIGCTSFAGATIVMLGIDCFSRAGLKEFWLYLWNLNPDVFPLNTDTYPMTRGVKAELAGVIIFTVFGIISQLRVWKLVKEHRAKSTAQELERARDQELEDEERGRKIEDKFQEERAQWEATYNKKDSQDSGSEDSIRDEKSMHAANMEVVSCQDYEFEQSVGKEAPVTVTVLQEDEIEQIDASGQPLPQTPAPAHLGSEMMSNVESARPSADLNGSDRPSRSVSQTGSLRPSSRPPPPVIIPLPFKVPQEEDVKSQPSDNASVSAMPDMEDEIETDQKYPPRRISNMSGANQRHSDGRISSNPFELGEGVGEFQAEDDRASSVAATLNEEIQSIRELSPPTSPTPDEPTEENEEKPDVLPENSAISTQHKDEVSNNETANTISGKAASRNMVPRQSLTISTDPKPLQSTHRQADRDDEISSQKQKEQGENAEELNGPPASTRGDSASDSFEALLPTEFSKVAQAFRVNEWSKHLEAAEKPEVDEIQEPESPGVHVDHERPAPVSEELARPLEAQKRNSNRASGAEPTRPDNAFLRSNSGASQSSQAKVPSLKRSSSALAAGGISWSGSQVLTRPSRNSTTTHLKPVIERGHAPTSPTTALSPSPANTLMGKRESLMRNRQSSQSFLQHSASTQNMTVTEEDMTLAERKRALKHSQKPPLASQKWQRNSRMAGAGAPSPTQIQVSNFDSHPPQRNNNSASDQKRESLLANWRESIRQDSHQQQLSGAGAAGMNNNSSNINNNGNGNSSISPDEQRRAALLQAKRQKELEKQQQAAAAQQRESMMHNMMRSNEMLDAHREAMRRMQMSANKRA